MLSRLHSNASMPSVASHILPRNGSIQSFKSYKDRVADIIKGESMHTGRRLTSSTDHISKYVLKVIDPNGGLCLLTKERGDEAPLDHAHIFPRCENNRNGLMTSLEFVFGIGYQLLNIDDVMNIIFLKCDWHRHFDARRWLLLPTIEMVEHIVEEHKHGQDITKVYGDARTFKYRMVPIGDGRLQDMLRYPRSNGTIQESRNSRPRGEVFEYPFTNLPEMESHAHPHWVILNAGMKLEGRSLSEMTALYEQIAEAYGVTVEKAKHFIKHITDLNLDWRSATPPEGFTSQGVDIAVPGLAAPGLAAPGLAAPGLATPRFAAPGLAAPGLEVVSPELAAPGLAAPGLATPRFAAPGFAAPGLAAPRIATPGIATPGLEAPVLAAPVLATPVLATPGLAAPGLGAPGLGAPGLATPGLEVVSPELAIPTVVDDPSGEDENTGSIGTNKSTTSNRFISTAKATIRLMSPKRSASSPDAASSLRLPPPERKRSRISIKIGKKPRRKNP